MSQLEHQRRVARLLRGERNVSDLDRLFADLRFKSCGKEVVREVGDFAAHRAKRDKGVVMRRVEDMQTGAGAWVRQMAGQVPTLDEARRVAEANLRIASEERIRDVLGLSHQQANTHYRKADRLLAEGKRPKGRQADVFNYLAGHFIWETAFTDASLMDDFASCLLQVGALSETDRLRFNECSEFVAMYALSIMHGSKIVLPGGGKAPLRLRTREETGTLRIQANIPVDNVGKPVFCAVSVFETSLDAETYSKVSPQTGDFKTEIPIEIGPDGILVEIK